MKRRVNECAGCGRIRAMSESTMLCAECDDEKAVNPGSGVKDLCTIMARQGVNHDGPGRWAFAWMV